MLSLLVRQDYYRYQHWELIHVFEYYNQLLIKTSHNVSQSDSIMRRLLSLNVKVREHAEHLKQQFRLSLA